MRLLITVTRFKQREIESNSLIKLQKFDKNLNCGNKKRATSL